MAGEMTDETNQAAAFSWMNVCPFTASGSTVLPDLMGTQITYRAGKVLGLPLGGYLSHPGRRFPIFHTEFWLKYPFALPCFAAASIAFVSLVVGQLTLKEVCLSFEHVRYELIKRRDATRKKTAGRLGGRTCGQEEIEA
jgi:hypothetical protein